MSEWHVGRNWVAPDPFAPDCGCEVLPCGLVDAAKANELECDQHSILASRTIRTSHLLSDCPEACPECRGSGAVMSFVDDDGTEHIEECDECDGLGFRAAEQIGEKE